MPAAAIGGLRRPGAGGRGAGRRRRALHHATALRHALADDQPPTRPPAAVHPAMLAAPAPACNARPGRATRRAGVRRGRLERRGRRVRGAWSASRASASRRCSTAWPGSTRVDAGRVRRGRRRVSRAGRERRRRWCGAPPGLRVPGLPRAAAPERGRQRGAAAAAAGPPRRCARGRRCWPTWAWAASAHACRSTLSGGQLQRVAIARALVHRPR